MKQINLANVSEASDSKRPTAGAYCCIIRNVEDIADREYLKITYDIHSGEFKGYYDELRANHPDWGWCGAYVRSYKPAALGMFKRFCSAVSNSNGGYVFDAGNVNADEKTLIGKVVGLVFQEEEYYGNDGEKKTRLIVNKEFPYTSEKDLATQRIPSIKRLKEEAPARSDFVSVANVGEIPF